MDAGTIPPCALVGLDNNHNSRYYSPYSHATTESSNNACQIVGEADSYLEHIVSEVMPVLGKHFALADTPEKVGLDTLCQAYIYQDITLTQKAGSDVN